MHSSGSSFWFIFRLICTICCIIAVTSYNIDYRSSIEDRNDRAVTEWRFRRNYLFNFPTFLRSHLKNNHLVNNEANENKQIDEIKLEEKKFIIPELIHPRSEFIKK